MERTAVNVRTGTINTGNPVDTTSSGHLVSVIVCFGIPKRRRHLVQVFGVFDALEKLRLRLGHDDAHDLAVPHQQIDGKHPMLHSCTTRVTGSGVAIMPSCVEHMHGADDWMARKGDLLSRRERFEAGRRPRDRSVETRRRVSERFISRAIC